MSDVFIRQATESDIPQLVDLMNSQYMRKKKPAYFLWQYFDPFYPTVLMCAFVGKKLVGMFGLQKKYLTDKTSIGQAIDMLVDRDYRRRGIFKELGRRAMDAFDDVDLYCVLPNLDGKNACENAFGFRCIGKINTMVFDLGLRQKVSGRSFLVQNKSGPAKKLIKFESNDSLVRWRFDRNPDYQYIKITLNPNQFVITKIFIDPENDKRFGDIVDFECDSENTKTLGKLVTKAIDYLFDQKVKAITTWALSHTALYELLKHLGFADAAQERYFCLKIVRRDLEYLYDFANWHLTQADCEIY